MKTKLFLTFAVAAFMTACSNDESKDNFRTESQDSMTMRIAQENELASLQAEALEKLKQRFVFDSGREYVELRAKSGARLGIYPRELRVKGEPVNGAVTVEFIEIYSRGDMATANKTTSGLANGQELNPEQPALNPLISGGEFYISLRTEEGQVIDDGAGYTLSVPTGATGGPDEEMTVWTGEEDWEDNDNDGGDGDGDVIWNEDQNEDGGDKDAPIEQDQYVLELDKFGWVNIDKLAEFPQEKTTIYVDVPNGYDDNNSKIYIAFEGQENMLIQLNTYNSATGYFGENYNLMPIGVQCHIIFVSGQAGNWLYAIKTITITPNGVETIASSDITIATQNDLINMLNSLP